MSNTFTRKQVEKKIQDEIELIGWGDLQNIYNLLFDEKIKFVGCAGRNGPQFELVEPDDEG